MYFSLHGYVIPGVGIDIPCMCHGFRTVSGLKTGIEIDNHALKSGRILKEATRSRAA